MHIKPFILISCLGFVYSHLFHSLNTVLDYGIREEITDLNFILGVTIAEAQLEILEDHISKNQLQHITPIIETLRKKCEILIDRAKGRKTQLISVFTPELWKVNTSPGRHLRHLRPVSPALTPVSTQGLGLNGDLSDECIRLLLDGCHTPIRCIIAELTDNAKNYQTTHQVLYWTLFNQKCMIKIDNSMIIEDLIKHKCGMILREHREIEEKNLPPELRDLYYEQMIVCGILGFSDFLIGNGRMITSLQHVKGCFTKYTHKEQPGRECDLHISGVATGVLALLIRNQYSPL